ncbi:hypothetical protein SAMN02745196_02162 [Clostridium collagenovorans DSM 3089]|uniref:GIY-YIG domain-containing protein n=1 Tax=Clostridium collagenovorans DSM 3089 TaxID=1121306 RepID=A0A1M5XED7_9CLOT|nr:hypothetical protein [Clostridium collagenovorans]SHH97864.1 hypothetical protein SAMN02745196_02162 [Clostridium collagenovorans DSM 3089]
MFGTIIMDAYTIDEAKDIANFIEENCSPLDNWGWASAGIYSFWDYHTKEVLYIGLASDLTVRFKQHNGLLPIDDGACKYQQIQQYFADHKRLGYSVLVQSSLSQPIVHRNENLYRKFLDAPKGMPIPDYAGREGIENIKLAEGQLIESYRQVVGDIPPWNKIGGNIDSRTFASFNNYQLVVEAFSKGTHENFLMSRSTLRELAKNAKYSWFEIQLHGLRMMMLSRRMTFEEAISMQKQLNPSFEKQWSSIVDSKYLDKKIII